MYKLIAYDLDETPLNTDREIRARNIAAIRRAEREYGVRFVSTTGRGYTCIDNVLHTLGVYDAEQEYTTSNNGDVVMESEDYWKLFFRELPYEITERPFVFGTKQGVCTQVSTAEDVYAFHLDEDEQSWLFSFKPDPTACEETSLVFLKGAPITKILLQNMDIPYLHTLVDQLHVPTNQRVAAPFSSNRYLELNPNGVGKGFGLCDLCEHLQIDPSETIAIDGNFSDVGMLREAGLSVAVANAVLEIEEMCGYVCTADHNEGAMAEVTERFIFVWYESSGKQESFSLLRRKGFFCIFAEGKGSTIVFSMLQRWKMLPQESSILNRFVFV